VDASERARGRHSKAGPASRHAVGKGFRDPREPSFYITLEQLSGGALLVDREWRIAAGNSIAARMFGREPDALSGCPIHELIPEWATLQAQLSPPARRRSPRVNTLGLRADQSSFALRLASSVIDGGDLTSILLFVDDMTRRHSLEANARKTHQALMDITERERSQEELRQSQARLQAAIRAGGIGTWIWELQEDRVLWDDAMYALWGCPRQAGALSGDEIGEFVHDEDRVRTRAEMDAFMSGEADDIATEFRIKRADDSVQWMSVTGRIERDANGRAARMIGACMDVTARKLAEDSQRHSQKIEALGTLAGGIAHDFNNILLAITGNARLAMADLPHNHPIRRSLVEIDKASARAANLVHRILAFSRQTEPRREVIALRPTIEEALRLLRAPLPAMIEIRTEFADFLPPVQADSTQIHQIMMNLITNSAHAIADEAGVVSVVVDTVDVDEENLPSRELKHGKYVRVRVSDTGGGMEVATLERIFDPFFTTKPAGQGTGLGLSVVHGIVRNHEGAIIVESTVGVGTTFHLYFPAAEHAAKAASETEREALKGHGQSIMYVDDEDALVYLATRMLERLGYVVSGYTDPVRALVAFQQHPGAFDVVVTDVSMPGMSGFHFARGVLAVRPNVPILMTSGYVRPQDREAAQTLGVRDLILKPNTVEELGHALARLFEEARNN
jgi:PAS domain S-box-containing protein